MKQLGAEYYFEDMGACPRPEFLKDLNYPWEAIGKNLLEVTPSNKGDVHETVVIKGDVEIGEGTVIHPYVVIEGPVSIGKNSVIRSFSLIRKGTILGDKVVIGHGTEVKNTMVFNGAKIASHAFVGDSVVGKGARIGSGTIIANRRFDQKDVRVIIEGKKIATGVDKCGAIIGDYVRLGSNCSTAPGTLIGKHTWVYPGVRIYGSVEKQKLVKLRQTIDVVDKEVVELKDTDKKGER